MTITEVDEYSGNKTHRAYIGGFIGGNSTTVCKLSDCAAIGNVTVVVKRSYNVFVGGFAGRLTQGSVITNCVYVPGEQFVDDQGNVTADGVMVTLMGPDALGEGEEVTVQKANVGLVIGYVDSNVKLTNVFAYADKFVCNPVASEANQITVNASTVSTDLSGLSSPN